MTSSIVLSFPSSRIGSPVPDIGEILRFRALLLPWQNSNSNLIISQELLDNLRRLEVEWSNHQLRARLYFGGPIPIYRLLTKEFFIPRILEGGSSKAHEGPNEDYRARRVIAHPLTPEAITMPETPVFRDVWNLLPDVVHGYYQMWPSYMALFRCEADVSAFVTRNVLEPCYLMINQLVDAWYELNGFAGTAPFIELSEQRYLFGEPDEKPGAQVQIWVDHVYMIRWNTDGKEDQPAVLVEDKAPGLVSIKDLEYFQNNGKGQVLDDMTKKCENMVRHLAQKLKYVEIAPCNFTVLLDGTSFIAMEWQRMPENYGDSHHATMRVGYWDMKTKNRITVVSMMNLLIRALIHYGVFTDPNEGNESSDGSRSSSDMVVGSP